MGRKIWLRKATEKGKSLSLSLKVPHTSAVVFVTPIRAVPVPVAFPAGEDAVSVFTLKRPGLTLPPCRKEDCSHHEIMTPVKGGLIVGRRRLTGTVGFVARVGAVAVTVTSPQGWDAVSSAALKLPRFTAQS